MLLLVILSFSLPESLAQKKSHMALSSHSLLKVTEVPGCQDTFRFHLPCGGMGSQLLNLCPMLFRTQPVSWYNFLGELLAFMGVKLENEAEISSVESVADSSVKGLGSLLSPLHQIFPKLIISFNTLFRGLDLNLFFL